MKKNILWLVLFNAAYILGFLIYYLFIGNYEFIWYIAIVVLLALLILITLKKTEFDNYILWGLSIWGLLHMAGGGVIVNGEVLYKLVLIPITIVGDSPILKFDQFVHFYGFTIAAIAIYFLLKKRISNIKGEKLIFIVSVIGSMGLGALNEIVEFMAVIFFSETGVGGYYNTALDLVFNTLGAILGAWIAKRKY